MSRVELPELPASGWCCNRPTYTDEQMRQYGEACAKAALEAAAGKCDQFAHAAAADRYLEQNYREGIEQGAIDCAEAIRALAVGSGGANE